MKRIWNSFGGLALTAWLLSTGACGREPPAGNFLRPSDDFSTLQFRSVPLQSISQAFIIRRLNDTYVWELPSAVKGELHFSLLVEISELPGRLQFDIRSDGRALLRETLPAGQFRRSAKNPNLSFWREYKLAGEFARKSRLAFSVRSSRKSASGTFALGDLRLKTASAKKPVNVLFLSIDTLRADYIGAYRKLLGIEPERPSFSPNLDRLAAEAALFTRAFTTQTSTWPALSSLFLSRMPFQHGVVDNGMLLAGAPESLAAVLFRNHFYTASFRANSYSLNLNGFSYVANFFNQDERLANNAAELIASNRDQRFFFWFHFMGVHAGYTPPAAVRTQIERQPFPHPFPAVDQELAKISRGERPDTAATIQYVRDCYAGELRQLDDWLERIFTELRRNGLWERTLIVVLADHGEDLYDHHRHFFHHPSIYCSALHIPLIIKFPGSAHRGVYTNGASIMDVAPTVLDALELPERLSGAEGRSLLPRLSSSASGDERPIFSESSGSRIFSLIAGRWHLIYNPENFQPLTQDGAPYPIQRLELYDVEKDQAEQRNMFQTRGDVTRRLIKELLQYLKSRKFSRLRRGLDVNSLPEETRQELETLGYI